MFSRNKKAYIYFLTASVSIIIVLLAFGIIFIRQAQHSLYIEKVTYLEEVLSKSAETIREQVKTPLFILESIATYIGYYESSFDTSETLAVLKVLSQKNEFKRMGLITPDGTAYTTDNGKYDFNDREYFHEAMSGKSSVSDCLIDKVDGTPINVFAAPISINGQTVGVVFATRAQDSFSENLFVESFGGKGYYYIITADGKPVITTINPNSTGEYENLFTEMRKYLSEDDLKKIENDIKSKRSGSFTYTRDDIERQSSYMAIGVNDWYIVSSVPTYVISNKSNILIFELMIFIILFIVFVGIGCWIAFKNFKSKNKYLENLVYVDAVTGYATWAKFCLDSQKNLEDNQDKKYAMIMIDIDKFKVFNDFFGHETGNKLLKFMAKVLAKNIKTNETFCRKDADHFNILIQYESDDKTSQFLKTILSQIENIVPNYKISFTAGIYQISEKDIDLSAFSDRATIAMTTAKKENNNFYHFFKDADRIELMCEKDIENIMEYALKSNEFKVYLQPKYSLDSDKIVGAEALVRWERADIGLIFPNEFIPLFEKNGFITKLDSYMFEQVCKILAEWKKRKTPSVPISVNISRVNFVDQSFPKKLLEIANDYDIEPASIEIELTESAVFGDIDSMITMMYEIKKAGFLISIDDFGSGYSSLSSLKDLPADYIKIDKSFLDKTLKDSREKKVIQGIISIAKLLGLSTVAEGVETKSQSSFLKQVGCDIAQGYYFSKPVDINEFESVLFMNQ